VATSEGSGIRTATCLVISVSMWPGDTRDTETPVPASCRRSASEKPRRPYLVAEYSGSMATRPDSEPTEMIAPCRRSSIPGSTARVSSIAPSRFTCARPVISPGGLDARDRDQEAPALFTSTSTRPKAVTVRSASIVTSEASDTSVGMATASPPASRIDRTCAASRPARRAASTTIAPRRASSRAVAAPMPELAPVTIATSPASAGIVRLAAYRI